MEYKEFTSVNNHYESINGERISRENGDWVYRDANGEIIASSAYRWDIFDEYGIKILR